MRTLEKILEAMKKAGENGDFEIAHSDADDLLAEALRVLARECDKVPQVEDILDAYDNVGKWYA